MLHAIGTAFTRRTDQPARTLEERKRVHASMTVEQERRRRSQEHRARRLTDTRERQARVKELLRLADDLVQELEAEELQDSLEHDHRLGCLRHQLATGAPAELDAICRDVLALADHARTKTQTSIREGFLNPVTGRRTAEVATNAGDVTRFLEAAQKVIADVEALKLAPDPDLSHLGPFSDVLIPGGPPLNARSCRVPAALAELFGAISGAWLGPPPLSPGEARELAWKAEAANEKRWSGEPYR